MDEISEKTVFVFTWMQIDEKRFGYRLQHMPSDCNLSVNMSQLNTTVKIDEEIDVLGVKQS